MSSVSQSASVRDRAHHDVRHVGKDSELRYNAGFGNEHTSEALPGALPIGQNSPQKCPYGLYAEQLSGTAFTVPRARNERSWLYRIRPSVMHARWVPVENSRLVGSFEKAILDPNQMRWFPTPMPRPDEPVDFLDGMVTMMGSGDPTTKQGMAIHVYTCNASMSDTALQNSDGDFLIIPQEGTLHIQTEMGFLDVAPREIAVIQRGIRFRVAVDAPSRGYICEVFSGHFTLPELGPIGANGLANARDFLYPVAAYEDRELDYVVLNKFGGQMYSTTMKHSPFDVVAWHGTYSPFKYNMERFCTMNSVSFDHPDPSIYTILTVPSDTPGVAVCDFVCFPPRWMVAEHTFRPPWFHRNCMTEFMGMVWGKYDAKVGFQPGGASLHSCMTPHGPDGDTFSKASNSEQKPEHFNGGLAFMLETTLMLKLTPWAVGAPHRDADYQKCWQKLPHQFNPARLETLASGSADGLVNGSGGMVLPPVQPEGADGGGAVAAAGVALQESEMVEEEDAAAAASAKRKRGTDL